MYFAYGHPRTLACPVLPAAAVSDDDSQEVQHDEWVYLQQDQDYLVAVSGNSVQLWSSGLHRVCLSVDSAGSPHAASPGSNIDAFWCGSRGALAVLVGRA
jgi:hypothetical protein